MVASGEDTAIFHVIYLSTATGKFSQNMLLDLLTISRRNNEARGLTGMLLYRRGFFLQFLEGQRGEVIKLLDRLREDPRHTGIRIIRDGVLPERLFPEWSMAYKNLVGLRSSDVPGYSEGLQSAYVNPHDKSPEQLLVDMFTEILVTA